MKIKLWLTVTLLIALLLTPGMLKAQTLPAGFDPVNKNASPEARQLLSYLYSISGRHIIAGHHNSVGRGGEDRWPDLVKKLTGKTPQIWGNDFIHYYYKGNGDAIVRAAHKKYQEGYIITLMWHAGRPQDSPPFGWKESVQNEMTDSEWTELTTPGTPLNLRWQAQADTVAVYLKKLQALGVPVLWRPYHENNGIWFWWGDKKGDTGFARLWRMMYDRYVNFHGLNNLIWVWNTNAPRERLNDEAYAYDLYFPGMDYVDVFATDVYHNDYRQSHHDDLAALAKGKLLALGEVGEVPSPAILDKQPLWSWFMIWSDWVTTHNTGQAIRDLYNYPRTLSHEDFLRERAASAK